MVFRDSSPHIWRHLPERYNMRGSKCLSCKQVFFPPRTVCPTCRSRGKIEKMSFSGKGCLKTYTVVRIAPAGYEEHAPYVLGIVNLEEGAMITGQVIDCCEEDLKIGMKVEAVFRKIRDSEGKVILYSFKFMPTGD